MDVFSLLKFWRNAGVGDPINAADFDDEGSLFDLVFTTTPNNDSSSAHSSPAVNVISGFHTQQQCSKLDALFFNNNINNNNKRKISPTTQLQLDYSNSSSNTKTTTPRSPFRVLMLGFQNHPKLIKSKETVEEVVTISSLLKRDNKLRSEKFVDQMPSKRFSKDVVNRYLNLIKPLVSRRANQKVRLSSSSLYTCPEKASVFKHMGKSRSSSSSVLKAAIPGGARRRDDSALDGIQSAILHCKKSYNSPSQQQQDGGCHVLLRSGSAPSSSQGARISYDQQQEEKRSSI